MGREPGASFSVPIVARASPLCARSSGLRLETDPPTSLASQFVKPLSTLKSLHTLRLCGVSSDSSTLPVPPLHSLRLQEVVLIEVK